MSGLMFSETLDVMSPSRVVGEHVTRSGECLAIGSEPVPMADQLHEAERCNNRPLTWRRHIAE